MNDMVKMVVATHNEGKLVEMRRILRLELGVAADRLELVSSGQLGLPDPVENGASFEQNALIKASDAACRTGLPAVADDSGLIVDILGSAPGILSARWAGRHGDDVANYELLLSQLADIPDESRAARFRCAVAFVLPDPTPRNAAEGGYRYAIRNEAIELGDMTGTIIHGPRGDNGFGYDPIFVPDDQPGRTDEDSRPLTSAQMTPDEKNAISHRYKALRAMAPHIQAMLLN